MFFFLQPVTVGLGISSAQNSWPQYSSYHHFLGNRVIRKMIRVTKHGIMDKITKSSHGWIFIMSQVDIKSLLLVLSVGSIFNDCEKSKHYKWSLNFAVWYPVKPVVARNANEFLIHNSCWTEAGYLSGLSLFFFSTVTWFGHWWLVIFYFNKKNL